ncbi:MAG: group 1 truncated hemoglobin [Microbacteriaceae bacterium]|nr:group 1 truncated hemoglobin [Microbacteriaceae bacterium]
MSLFEQVGGTEGIRRFVDELSRRLDDDPELGPLFEGVEGSTLRAHREHYFAAVLGGPENYSGRGLREAHRPLGLTDAQLDRFLVVADESLAAVSAPAEAAAAVHELLERLRPVIVTPSRPA